MGAWLDGLLTNRVREAAPVFAALLSPQGKIVADMVVTPDANGGAGGGGGYLIDTTEAMGAELLGRLKMYVLRAPIMVEAVDVMVQAVWDEDEAAGHVDPRHASLGRRVIGAAGVADASLADYDRHRLSLGVPDSLFDYGPGEMFPHDACMDELNGVDLHKGCFVGQEVVSRMARLGTVRKRIRTVLLEGEANVGDEVRAGAQKEGRRVGDVLHVEGGMASALMRLDRVAAATESLTVGGVPCRVMAGPQG